MKQIDSDRDKSTKAQKQMQTKVVNACITTSALKIYALYVWMSLWLKRCVVLVHTMYYDDSVEMKEFQTGK